MGTHHGIKDIVAAVEHDEYDSAELGFTAAHALDIGWHGCFGRRKEIFWDLFGLDLREVD